MENEYPEGLNDKLEISLIRTLEVRALSSHKTDLDKTSAVRKTECLKHL